MTTFMSTNCEFFLDTSRTGVQVLGMFSLYKCLYFNLEACPILGSSNSTHTMLHLLEPATLKSKFLTMHGLPLVKPSSTSTFIHISAGCSVAQGKSLNNPIVLLGSLGICWRMRSLISPATSPFTMSNANTIHLLSGNAILKAASL